MIGFICLTHIRVPNAVYDLSENVTAAIGQLRVAAYEGPAKQEPDLADGLDGLLGVLGLISHLVRDSDHRSFELFYLFWAEFDDFPFFV